jgi:XrtJ-associated TM-motif-TM protein
MNRRLGFLIAMTIAAIAVPLHAQGGCTDSPESPTIVLALVGGIGVIAVALRAARHQKQ